MDNTTTVEQLRTMVREFVDERQWNKYHSPKNISMALTIEAAELMEHFQWISIDESRTVAREPEKLTAVGEELADVLCYGLALANELDIDISTAMRSKMEKNRKKYPIDEYLGQYEKDTTSD